MNARERVVDIAQALKYGDGSYGELRDALDAYREDILRDAEVVAGKWEVRLSESGVWYVGRTDAVLRWLCPDERTAKAYANALNRADRHLEGTNGNV